MEERENNKKSLIQKEVSNTPSGSQKIESKRKLVKNSVVLSLENTILSTEQLLCTPTQKDLSDFSFEIQLRAMGCELIQICGRLLRLPQVAVANAQVLFQRFYYKKSFLSYDFHYTALGCLLLASKVEECPIRCRPILNVYYHVKHQRENNKNEEEPKYNNLYSNEYISAKNNVIKAERRVLKELGFSVHFQHPHKLLINYLMTLSLHENISFAQKTWNYMNDSLRTNIFQRFQPNVIASSIIYLVSRDLNISLPEKEVYWWKIFDVELEDIKECVMTILFLYKLPKISWIEVNKTLNAAREKNKTALLEKKTTINNSYEEDGIHGNDTINADSNKIEEKKKSNVSDDSTKYNLNRHSEEKSRHYSRSTRNSTDHSNKHNEGKRRTKENSSRNQGRQDYQKRMEKRYDQESQLENEESNRERKNRREDFRYKDDCNLRSIK